MSFCFNFPNPTCAEEKNIESISNACEQDVFRMERDNSFSLSCGFMSMKSNTLENSISKDANEVKFGAVSVKYVCLKSLKEKTENEDLLCAEKLQSDLIPGKYEGGFKVWESCLDLSQFLVDENVIKPSDKVLELGCGAGFPGIIALLKGATVTFQDFNAEVLELLTMTNVLLNNPNLSSYESQCQFLYGDWTCIKEKYFSGCHDEIMKYDVILTSETIYDKASMKKLLDLIKSSLKATGIVYLAAKTHYFGVGGGIIDFEDLLMADGTFEISDVHKIKAGVERQILKLKFKGS
ncbi:histidine protein methyltransferase 1 homolog isoform X2 [Uloborus diversus]|uniref:histidine protein methyltransferase 1 homolog isoform X2 n=1 Tax=Uloborus diversus TaxID=327109 RepID=UPI00240A7F69|nr:histidine protein methyltransferase 1 homolog isoform X2 [Uloborus diversus]